LKCTEEGFNNQEAVLIVGNLNPQGLNVGHVSQEFEHFFGYSATECVGQECFTFVGVRSILNNPVGLESARYAAGRVHKEEVESQLRLLRDWAASQAKAAGTCLGTVSSVILPACRNTGELFVCEVAVRGFKHPQMGWPYCVGLFHDISNEICIEQLLGIASADEYSALLNSRGKAKARSTVIFDDEAFVSASQKAAASMWRGLIGKEKAGDLKSCSGNGVQQMPCSLWSRSTGLQDEDCSQNSSLSSFMRSQDTLEPMKTEDEESDTSGAAQRATPSEESDTSGAAQRAEQVLLTSDGPPHVVPGERFLDLLEDCHPGRQELLLLLRGGILSDIEFPAIVIDVLNCTHPLAACSSGYAKLMGCPVSEAIGAPCDEPFRSAPECSKQQLVCTERASFLEAAGRADYYTGKTAQDGVALLPQEERDVFEKCLPRASTPEGELNCLLRARRVSGEVFWSMSYLKQVELEDHMFVVEVQAEVKNSTDTADAGTPRSTLPPTPTGAMCATALVQLHSNLDTVCFTLASQFWYSAPMRQQSPVTLVPGIVGH